MVIVLPLAAVIQSPSLATVPAVAPEPTSAGSILPMESVASLPPVAGPGAPADRQLELHNAADQPSLINSGITFMGDAYDREAIDYLSEVGFGAEYGSSSSVLHKWTEDVNLRILGSPTAADIATLTQVVAELNGLIGGIKLTLNGGPADLEVHFAPESRFESIEPHYIPVNYGFFRVWWDHEGAIYRGRILVASEGITQPERSHLIREEVTQSLGLFRDSWNYPDSIFYQGWIATGEYAIIDRPTIRLLYQPQLLPGMTKLEVRNLLSLN